MVCSSAPKSLKPGLNMVICPLNSEEILIAGGQEKKNGRTSYKETNDKVFVYNTRSDTVSSIDMVRGRD